MSYTGRPLGRFVLIKWDREPDREMCWPAINEQAGDVVWRLTHAPESVTREDQLFCASVLSAYHQMVSDPIEKRNGVCRAIREATQQPT